MSGSFLPSLGRQSTTVYLGRGSQHCYEIKSGLVPRDNDDAELKLALRFFEHPYRMLSRMTGRCYFASYGTMMRDSSPWSSGDCGNWPRRNSMKRRERGRPLVR